LNPSIDKAENRALFDNLGNGEVLASKIDTSIRYTKKADWVGDRLNNVKWLMLFEKNQHEYQ